MWRVQRGPSVQGKQHLSNVNIVQEGTTVSQSLQTIKEHTKKGLGWFKNVLLFTPLRFKFPRDMFSACGTSKTCKQTFHGYNITRSMQNKIVVILKEILQLLN